MPSESCYLPVLTQEAKFPDGNKHLCFFSPPEQSEHESAADEQTSVNDYNGLKELNV